MITSNDLIEIPNVDDAAPFTRGLLAAFKPREQMRTLEWCIQNIVTNEGRPFDHLAFPHLGAPGGPFDAFDDVFVRSIALQFATRLGKTFGPICSMLKTAQTDPAPMMIASDIERSTKRVMRRVYEMIRKQPRLRESLKHRTEADQRVDLIEFRDCKCVGAWGRSVSTLADEDIKVGLANEIDKPGWDQVSTSREGEPLKLFSDRFKDWQSVRKQWFECTPSIKGRSRIDSLRIGGWNCQYWVPCPHCHAYQPLEFGKKETTHGIKWDPLPNGHHTDVHALNTARYVCQHCNEPINDDPRGWMMRRGVWVPEGAGVDDSAALEITETSLTAGRPTWEWDGWANAEWITGEPNNDGPFASHQLSSLYALSLSWGDVAAEFVRSNGRASELRNFWNQWLALTWEIRKRKADWEHVGGRLVGEFPRGVVPADHSIITIGIDKQEYFYVFVVLSWNPDASVHVVAYGQLQSVDDVKQTVIINPWPHIDGGDPVISSLTLMDSGWRPARVHDFVSECAREQIQVAACKGASNQLNGFYETRRNSTRSSNPHKWVVRVDSFATNDWLDERLYEIQPHDPGGMTIHHGSMFDHRDFLQQLVGEVPDDKGRWQPVDDNTPVDYRDACRYAKVAQLITTRHAPIRERNPTESQKTPKRPPRVKSPKLPGGDEYYLFRR